MNNIASIAEAAQTLECSIRTVWRRIKVGMLHGFRIGKKTYVLAAEVMRLAGHPIERERQKRKP